MTAKRKENGDWEHGKNDKLTEDRGRRLAAAISAWNMLVRVTVYWCETGRRGDSQQNLYS